MAGRLGSVVDSRDAHSAYAGWMRAGEGGELVVVRSVGDVGPDGGGGAAGEDASTGEGEADGSDKGGVLDGGDDEDDCLDVCDSGAREHWRWTGQSQVRTRVSSPISTSSHHSRALPSLS